MEDDNINLDLPAIQARYEGTRSGHSMEGTWQQAGQVFPLNLEKLDASADLGKSEQDAAGSLHPVSLRKRAAVALSFKTVAYT